MSILTKCADCGTFTCDVVSCFFYFEKENEMSLYAERDIMALDESGEYYARHMSAMTGEGLHDKSEIAAELAHRDAMIDSLMIVIVKTRGQAAKKYKWLGHFCKATEACDGITQRCDSVMDNDPRKTIGKRR